jgi:hypothetical protein
MATMTTASNGVDRILVLLEGGTAETTLDLAAELASQRRLPLVGLLVEDADLLSSAGLPFAREIGLVSGQARPLDPQALEARMRERETRFRSRLTDIGHRLGIPAELQVGRGRRAQAVLERVHPSDMLVVRRSAWAQRPGGLLEGVLVSAECAVALLGASRKGEATGAGPMVLLDGTEGATRALSRAIALARREQRELALAVPRGHASQGAREQARSALAAHGIDARFVELEAAGAGALVRAARRARPQFLFVSRESPLLAGTDGAILADSEDVPLVLVP